LKERAFHNPSFRRGIEVSKIVCPACQAYLGLAAAGATACPRCAAPLSAAPAGTSPVCPGAESAEAPAGDRDVVHGGLWLLGGILVTVVTYVAAEERGGGRYIIAWGAMVFGGLQFLRGLFGGGRK
jgi:hypothetical protein